MDRGMDAQLSFAQPITLKNPSAILSVLPDSNPIKQFPSTKLAPVHLSSAETSHGPSPRVLYIPPSLAHLPLMPLTEGTGASFPPWINKSARDSWLTDDSWSIFTQHTFSSEVYVTEVCLHSFCSQNTRSQQISSQRLHEDPITLIQWLIGLKWKQENANNLWLFLNSKEIKSIYTIYTKGMRPSHSYLLICHSKWDMGNNMELGSSFLIWSMAVRICTHSAISKLEREVGREGLALSQRFSSSQFIRCSGGPRSGALCRPVKFYHTNHVFKDLALSYRNRFCLGPLVPVKSRDDLMLQAQRHSGQL